MILDKQISRIGLGCVTFGREIHESASFELMDYAQAHGILFFDTAAAYSDGASETIVGKWMASRHPVSDSIMVATKILPPFDSKSIASSVEESLKRLDTETIDLLYLHRWHPTLESFSALNALNDLVKQGKVRTLGASNFSAEQLTSVLSMQSSQRFTNFQSIQNNNNLAVSDINEKLRIVCAAYDIKIVTYSPLGAGFLTGKHQQGVQAGSRFDLIPGHQNIYFNNSAYHRLARLREVAAREGYSPIHLALAWALHQLNVTSVLVGGRTVMHLDQALAALDFNMPTLFAEIEST